LRKPKNNRSNIVDEYVGARLRVRRIALGMSQSKLGEKLGVTFQQIQKYEKGSNRISAARLKQAAEVLGATVQSFLEGAPSAEPSGARGFAEVTSPPFDIAFLSRSEGHELGRAFARIADPKVRRHILDLVIALAPPE
jgi:transcriptional regulator with XRE-family HTH domain